MSDNKNVNKFEVLREEDRSVEQSEAGESTLDFIAEDHESQGDDWTSMSDQEGGERPLDQLQGGQGEVSGVEEDLMNIQDDSTHIIK